MTVKEAKAAYDAAVKLDRKRRVLWLKAERNVRKTKRKYGREKTPENRSALAQARAHRNVRKRLYKRSTSERTDSRARWIAARRAEAAPLRVKAYNEATKLIGVMERGGNNAGEDVARIIKGGGGNPSDRPAWCGYFVAYCYRLAGSKAVDWHWAAVRLYVPLAGIRRTSKPLRGDLVRFNFDHIGMFVKDNGDGTISTIEGNTSSVGAVSDSKTGGDGVYRKNRSKTLVRDYLRVTR